MYNVTYETTYLIEGTLKWKTDSESRTNAILDNDDFENAIRALNVAWFKENEKRILENINISYRLHIVKLEYSDIKII